MTLARREVLAGAGATAAVAVTARPRRTAGKPHGRFLWGAATAAHQIEGGNVNSDYWVLEHIPATYFKEPSGDACNSWELWREDLALVKAGGMNAYRFSIEWARIEPERGEFSNAALDHYRRICLAARELGIEPVVTFHHFTSPRWIAAQGGWENPRTADDYARYAERSARGLRDVLGHVCTFNEPNAQVTSKVMELDKPWDKEPGILAQAARAVASDRWGSFFLGNPYRSRDTIIAAHGRARDAIKSAAPGAKVGLTLALQDNVPVACGEALDRRVREEARIPFYEAARRDDFVGVQPYTRERIGPRGYVAADRPAFPNAGGGDAAPDVIAVVATEVHRATGRPVMITENGINTTDDAIRIAYLKAAVASLATAIDGGLPVLGYMHWSLLDNFEWSSGYAPKFGLVAVDRTTFRRTPKPSFAAYRATIAAIRARHSWA